MSTWKVDVGPLLRYDTVDSQGVYHAFALIVTQHPRGNVPPTAPILQYVTTANQQPTGPPLQTRGLLLYVYDDETNRSHAFWRFKIEVKMLRVPQQVAYIIPGASELLDFFVPAFHQEFRWSVYSCSGFSSSVNQEDFGGFDPMWNDMLREHAINPFHVMIGGGDQIYNDGITQNEKIKSGIRPRDMNSDEEEVVSPEIVALIDSFIFKNYLECFNMGAIARAMSRIPMVNMLDDHDLIDGFGTYPDDLMTSGVFSMIGSRAYFFYLLFQQFMNDKVDGIINENTKNVNPSEIKSLIIGGPGCYIPFPTHSFLVWLGPKQHMLLLDCRAQRKLNQVCAEDTYERVFEAMENMPSTVRHLIIQLGVPISYPRMVYLENMLSNRYNPFVSMAKAFMPAFTNNFNGQVELLDDLNDHWCAAVHKKERNQLIERVQALGKARKLRVSYVSGDVHAGGCGVFQSNEGFEPSRDPRYSLALITSAIVNAPPPSTVITIVNKLAAKPHKSMHYANTRETMLPWFEEDLQDKKSKEKYIIGARNWCAVDYDESTDEIVFNLHVEKAPGTGRVKVYTVKTPPPLF